MFLTHLECTECNRTHDGQVLQRVCTDCGAPLEARYDLERVRAAVQRSEIADRRQGLWSWRELLPLPADAEPVTLGEGGTPLLDLPRMGAQLGLAQLSLKDEALNPTGSFKARGMTLAVSMAKHLGATALSAPSAGNAGGALAAYGARAGLPVHIAMPTDVPRASLVEAQMCGAHVQLVDGTISDCGAWLRQHADPGCFDISTLKEPYRVEGKKTMGLELALDMGWDLPDVILYPTGGGTGLVGMWKAFAELRALGWLPESVALPRMVAVQAEGCAPIVRAFESGATAAEVPQDPQTLAAGLRVPAPLGDRWILRVLRESQGTAVALSDEELLEATRTLARTEGIFAAPEGGALIAALARLRKTDWVKAGERVVLFNTGTGLKYLECF